MPLTCEDDAKLTLTLITDHHPTRGQNRRQEGDTGHCPYSRFVMSFLRPVRTIGC